MFKTRNVMMCAIIYQGAYELLVTFTSSPINIHLHLGLYRPYNYKFIFLYFLICKMSLMKYICFLSCNSCLLFVSYHWKDTNQDTQHLCLILNKEKWWSKTKLTKLRGELCISVWRPGRICVIPRSLLPAPGWIKCIPQFSFISSP